MDYKLLPPPENEKGRGFLLDKLYTVRSLISKIVSNGQSGSWQNISQD